jgi:hypothetical protein
LRFEAGKTSALASLGTTGITPATPILDRWVSTADPSGALAADVEPLFE